MGKKILAQRKGRGTLAWQSPSHRHIGAVKYRPFKEGEEQFKFKVPDSHLEIFEYILRILQPDFLLLNNY